MWVLHNGAQRKVTDSAAMLGRNREPRPEAARRCAVCGPDAHCRVYGDGA